MARSLRIEGENLWYHVFNRGNEKRDVFLDDADYRLFLDIFFDLATEFHVEIHSFAIMPNHFHLYIMTRKANLCRFMHRAGTKFANRYNDAHQRVGHVFQGRYKAIVVDTQEYGRELTRYIHLNPARSSKLTESNLRAQLRMLRDYPWSSYRTYAGLSPCPWPVHVDGMLDDFGEDDGQRHRRYARFVKEGLVKPNAPLEKLVAQSILGSDDFVDRMRRLLRSNPRHDHSAKGARSRLAAHGLGEVLNAVYVEFGVEPAAFMKRRPVPAAREARRVALWAAARYCVCLLPLEEIGRRMDGIRQCTVTLARKLVEADIAAGRSCGVRALAVAARLQPDFRVAGAAIADEDWLDMYERLVAYHARYGHAMVQRRFSKDHVLGAWAERQRLARRGGSVGMRPLNDQQIALLDKLGFLW